ncbi:hypothetical protein PO124_20750 [Bacillus licheniformis]|nr:hypothetical protein [Bacillus licheniformis]
MDVADAIISLGEQKSCSLKMKGVIIRPFTTLNKALPKGAEIAGQTEYDDQFPESEFLLALGELEERMKVQYAPSQKKPYKSADVADAALTGGPGTGKRPSSGESSSCTASCTA